MIVVDASVLVDLLIDRPGVSEQVLEAIADDGSDLLHAPDLVQLEALQALRRHVRGGQLQEDDAQAIVLALQRSRLVLHPVDPLIDRVWALRNNLSAYDASYLALAETVTDSTLLTGDNGLALQARRSLGASRVRHLT